MTEMERQERETRPAVLRFVREVVDNGLMRVVAASKERSMSGHFNGVALRSFVMAGRVMFTLESEGGTVSLLGQEEDTRDYKKHYKSFFGEDKRTENFHRVGLHNLECTVGAANHMIGAVCDGWPTKPAEQKHQFHNDPEVTLDVLAGIDKKETR
jgi:hypothetical protein